MSSVTRYADRRYILNVVTPNATPPAPSIAAILSLSGRGIVRRQVNIMGMMRIMKSVSIAKERSKMNAFAWLRHLVGLMLSFQNDSTGMHTNILMNWIGIYAIASITTNHLIALATRS